TIPTLDRSTLINLATAQAMQESQRLCLVQVELNQQTPLIGVKAQLLIEKLKRLGRILLTMPACESFDKCENLSVLEIGLLTNKPDSEICRAVNVSGVNNYALEEISRESIPVEPQPTTPALEVEMEEVVEE